MPTDLILDIGANIGQFGCEVGRLNPDKNVICIEPVPALAETIQQRLAESCLSNVSVIRSAVGLQEGVADFNISKRGDWGISSLLKISVNNVQGDDYWSSRSDLIYDETFEVEVSSLERILDGVDFDRIPFIKIDVQGRDLDVLRSAGKYLSKIEAGVVEVVSTLSCSIYEDVHDDLRSCLNYLDENGFQVSYIKPNDPAANEFNVFFTKVGCDLKVVERELNLRGLEEYDGKFFWHAFSDSPRYADDLHKKIIEENERLLARISELDSEIVRLDAEVNRLNIEIESNYILKESQE
ncbi:MULTISPECIES: FkbM family methyltransferase [unclassified Pseudomonas]|uniref:FkbM family methyltransferase n=1 Tax=unclassified Pseudomonas TaxID=196821 RepID=UPI00131BE99C|nr:MULTISPECIES: FkbM family methyltransferase [unclassified Pseudomonas]